jgi:hypothetical protein
MSGHCGYCGEELLEPDQIDSGYCGSVCMERSEPWEFDTLGEAAAEGEDDLWDYSETADTAQQAQARYEGEDYL